MLRSRFVVYLLTDGEGLLKTHKFLPHKYLGDPINAIKTFNELGVDELVLLDIRASQEKRPPNFKLIEAMARQCRMPFGYGGGINSSDAAQQIIASGCEKVVLGDSALHDPGVVGEIAARIGRQSVAAVVNYKRSLMGKRKVKSLVSKSRADFTVDELVSELVGHGAGEIVFYDIDRDGERSGFDLDCISHSCSRYFVPLTFVGGCGAVDHFVDALDAAGRPVGLGAGSFFTLHGKHLAPLLSYDVPNFS